MINNDFCKWEEDIDGVWWTECGDAFFLEVGYPKENHYNYCPSCGKLLIEEPYVEEFLYGEDA